MAKKIKRITRGLVAKYHELKGEARATLLNDFKVYGRDSADAFEEALKSFKGGKAQVKVSVRAKAGRGRHKQETHLFSKAVLEGMSAVALMGVAALVNRVIAKKRKSEISFHRRALRLLKG